MMSKNNILFIFLQGYTHREMVFLNVTEKFRNAILNFANSSSPCLNMW